MNRSITLFQYFTFDILIAIYRNNILCEHDLDDSGKEQTSRLQSFCQEKTSVGLFQCEMFVWIKDENTLCHSLVLSVFSCLNE